MLVLIIKNHCKKKMKNRVNLVCQIYLIFLSLKLKWISNKKKIKTQIKKNYKNKIVRC